MSHRALAAVLTIGTFASLAVASSVSAATPGAGVAGRPGRADGAVPVNAEHLARIQQIISAKEYEASPGEHGLQAPNRAHNLRTYFEPGGVRVVDRTAPGSPLLVELRPVGLGRQTPLRPVGPGTVVDRGNRVEIRRPQLVEWYVNSPRGLEQGFTLRDRPSGRGPLVLELSVEDARVSLRGSRVSLATSTGRTLSYSRLEVLDANGTSLKGHFETPDSGRLRIVIADGNASYPITIDPLLTETEDALIDADLANAKLGYGASGAGDVNGDGYADVIVGAPFFDVGGSPRGAAFIFHGGPTGIVASGNPSNANTELYSDSTDAEFGFSAAGAGDVNGDGYADVIVGAPWYDLDDELKEGAAFVYLGGAAGIPDGGPTTADAVLQSNQGTASLGTSVASAGDVNGDGYADVIVGAPYYSHGEAFEGVALVFLGGLAGVTSGDPSSAHSLIESNQVNALLGVSVACAGDVDSDGYSDVIVGAEEWDQSAVVLDEGAAFIFYGGPGGLAANLDPTGGVPLDLGQADARFGGCVAGAGDVDGDGFSDVIVGARMYRTSPVGSNCAFAPQQEGGAFVYYGGVGGISIGAVPGAVIVSQDDRAWLGYSVASAGDVNGDGYSDVVVGAPRYGPGCPGAPEYGVALVFLGGPGGIVANGNVQNADYQLWTPGLGPQLNASMGWAVAGVGDVNGDGYADVISGAIQWDDPVVGTEIQEGAAFVYYGGPKGIAGTGPAGAHAMLQSNQDYSGFGYAVADAGDVNGDGYGDIIVGASAYDSGENNEGAAFIFLGGSHGIASGNPMSADTQIESNHTAAGLGISVDGAGDVNGDGYGDVIVGVEHGSDNGGGAAYIFHGGPAGIADGDSSTADGVILCDQSGAELGASVAGAGDVNGDGYGDVIVGAFSYDADETNEGAAFVFHGGPAGISIRNPSNADAVIQSNQVNAELGTSVDGAGDVNGDGYADVIVGAPFYDELLTSEGAAFVFLGSSSGIVGGDPSSASAELRSNQMGAQMGTSVAGAGDVNGDGYADVIVGAPFYDSPTADEGAAFLFMGSNTGIAGGDPSFADTQLESNQGSAEFGCSVSGAGDVNGDGYADVIVGARLYDSGQTDEGAAFVFMGASAGIPNGGPSSGSKLESDQMGANMGAGVSTAGDINGDGFADVIVGSELYSSDETREGVAFLFTGNSEGRPVDVRQLRGGGDNTPVQSWGRSYDAGEFQITLNGMDPSGRGSVKLQVEACPPGHAFGDGICETRTSSPWLDTGMLDSGVPVYLTFDGLSNEVLYRWRARVLHAPTHVTEPGITPPPNPAHGPWRRLLGQAREADIRTALAPLVGVCCPDDAPDRVRWLGSYPNPSRRQFSVSFQVARPADATLEVFDLNGRLLRSIHAAGLSPGEHALHWDGRNIAGGVVPGGVYFYAVRIEGAVIAQGKVVMLR